MEEKELGLSQRLEGTRDKLAPKVIKFDIDQIFERFSEALEVINAQLAIADELCKQDRSIEAEYIWRSQVVFLASALDFYMHELTKLGLCAIYDNKWDKTEKYNNIKLPMKVLEKALKEGEEADWFLEYINDYFKTVTMISNQAIKDQFSLLGIEYQKVADNAFYQKGSTEKTTDALKRRLDELFRRRNMIAHQTDRMHSDAQLQGISKEIVMSYVTDIEEIVKAINAEVENK